MINWERERNCCWKFNADQLRIWTRRWMCFRSVTISLKTSKSKQNIGLRHATFDILNFSRVQKWRGGRNYDKYREHHVRLWLNEVSGVVLVDSWKDHRAKQTFKTVSDSEFKRGDEAITINKTVQTQSQSHELIIHNLQVLSLDLHFSNSFEIRLNFWPIRCLCELKKVSW